MPQVEYRQLIQHCRQFLGRREINPIEAKHLAAKLRAVHSVAMENDTTVVVDTKPEADALDGISGTTPDKKLADSFDALDDQLGAGHGLPRTVDPRAMANSVLDASEFSQVRPKPDRGWGPWKFPNWKWPHWFSPVGNGFAKALKSFGMWIRRSFENVFRGLGRFFRWMFKSLPQPKFGKPGGFANAATTMLLTIYFLMTVAAVVGIYFLVNHLYSEYERRNGRGKGGTMLGGDLDLSEEGITDPLGTAKARAQQGDYRAAIRLTYIAALWRLGDSGLLTLEKNRTNWEYQRSLRKRSSKVHDELIPATRLFDRVWYGKQKGTQAEFEAVSAIYEKLPTEFATPDLPATPEGTPV